MPALPAITFLGLRGTAAWLALAGGAAGAYIVVTRALPTLAPRGGGAGGRAAATSPAAPTAELLVGLLRAATEASGRVATAALGPGASIGIAGLGVARDVTGALERFAEQQTRAITQTSSELIRSQSAENLAILQLAQPAPAPVFIGPPPAPAPVFIGPPPAPAPVFIGPPPARAPVFLPPVFIPPIVAPVVVQQPAPPAPVTLGRALFAEVVPGASPSNPLPGNFISLPGATPIFFVAPDLSGERPITDLPPDQRRAAFLASLARIA